MAEKANESEFQGPNLENLELFVKPRTKLSVGRNAAIKSAELTFDREVIVLKNLSSLQPLSHLINEDAIMNKLGNESFTLMFFHSILQNNESTQ